EEPEVQQIGERGAKNGGEGEAGPGLPGDGQPVGERTERGGLAGGDRDNDQGAEQIVPGGHGEGVVVPRYALAEDGIKSKGERAAEGDGIAKKRGRVARDAAGSGGKNRDASE